MAQKTLELTLISAKDLKDVNLFSKMEVYAVVDINGDARTRQRTRSDRDGGSSPAWNATLRLLLPPAGGTLHVLLRAERALGDRDVGEVHIPLRELVDGEKARPGQPQFLSYQVRKPGSGKPKGVINISYRVVDAASSTAAAPPPVAYPAPAPSVSGATAAYPPPGKAPEPVSAYPPASAAYPPPGKAPEPVTAYPAAYPPSGAYPQAGAASAAPYSAPAGYPSYPPPPQYGPPAGYGYPPAGYGYGAVPPAQPPKKNKFGMGLGAGLLGGALGGLLIGDMVSDAGAYDAGYDAGYDDAGGFDF